jgi:hypothetical protein
VTLEGIENENVMYEWIPLKVKFLYGKWNLEMSLGKGLRFPSPWVLAEMFVPSRDTKKTKYACNMLGVQES